MKTRITAVLAAFLLLLSGCQATPEKGVVASKADGAFEAALTDKVSSTLVPAAEEPPAAETAPPTAVPAVHEDSFDGAQEGVRFHVKVAEPAVPGPCRSCGSGPWSWTGRSSIKWARYFTATRL